jgi:hypothetical protein
LVIVSDGCQQSSRCTSGVFLGAIIELCANLAYRPTIDAYAGEVTGLDLTQLLQATRPSVPVWIASGRRPSSATLSRSFRNYTTCQHSPANMLCARR